MHDAKIRALIYFCPIKTEEYIIAEIRSWLPSEVESEVYTHHSTPFVYLLFPRYGLQIHIITFDTFLQHVFEPDFFLLLLAVHPNLQTIHLWEDQFQQYKSIVKNRLLGKLGLTQRIHGRQTKIIRIDKAIAFDFMQGQHLQGYTQVYYKYGLFKDDILYAVALFSKVRSMKAENYKSGELVRYANLDGYHVSGGLSKLINYYIQEQSPQDVMTYVDKDWGVGSGYDKIGFERVEHTPPQCFWVNLNTFERHYPSRFIKLHPVNEHVSKDIIKKKYGLVEIYNSGNIKMIKTC